MKVTTYKSLLTKKKTWVIVQTGKIGTLNYIEYQISYDDGHWVISKTDGFQALTFAQGKLEKSFSGEKGLKSVINLIYNT